jgi:hypothetical protein
LDNKSRKFKYGKTRYLGGAGTQTAALAFGGYATGSVTAATEEYDGTSWTTSNPTNSKK